MWDLDQVKRANLVVDKLIDAIKKENLSPLQTIAFISAFAFKNFSYSDLQIPINLANVRLKGETQNNIVVAVSCGEIQCVGYDQFFNAITGDLFYHFTNNGDHLISESISIINSEEHEGHAVSVVDLKDKKYSIDDRFLVDINLIRLNVLKRPISDFKPGIYTITKDVDNNIIKSDGTIINSEDFLNQTDHCSLCTNIDGYKYVPSELSGFGKYLAQEMFRPKKKLFGPHYKSFKVLHLAKMSNKDCVKLMSKVYDDIKDVKIPSIEDLFRQPVDKEPNL